MTTEAFSAAKEPESMQPSDSAISNGRLWGGRIHTEPQFIFFETRAINSSNLERRSLRMGESLDFLWPRTSSMVGVFPFKGRLVTEEGRKFWA